MWLEEILGFAENEYIELENAGLKILDTLRYNIYMVTWNTIEELSSQIASKYEPEKIILFGSYAYGSATDDSDVDLLVILPFQGKSFRKSLEILNSVDPHFAVDLFARNPDDTARRYVEGDPLIREALDKGKILYERDH